MKKLTLDEVWEYCLEQWKYISEEWLKGNKDIRTLKREWQEKQGFEDIYLNCFFCNYTLQQGGSVASCTNCPGILVDKEFRCLRSEYNYFNNPVEFYKKLVALNKKRTNKLNEN